MASNNGREQGRKFNIGRQGEQLLNEEWHSLFMTLKYLNYNRYQNINTDYPIPERQREVPAHALRLKSEDNLDLLQTFYPNLGSDGMWKNIFEGYYHPANTIKPAEGEPVAPYQLCIDPKSGAIMYWSVEQNDWMVAHAIEYTGQMNYFNGLNFQHIYPLETLPDNADWYPVPAVMYGKIFDDGLYTKIEDVINQFVIKVKDDANKEALSWVHINACKLIRIDRRLIKLGDKNKIDFIGVSSTQSEFYGFKKGDKLGKLLRRDIEFIDEYGGIKLNENDFDYIYVITYVFEETPSKEGIVLSKEVSITGKNEVYIGSQISDSISVFMDGLSLEQTDENNEDIYIHDRAEGSIIFTDDDDAEIINEMQMSVLLFPDRTKDFSISSKASNVTINSTENTVTVLADLDKDVSQFKTPMVFCSGLGLQETAIFEDVTIDGNRITIKDLVLPGDEVIKGYVADVGDSFICKGVLNSTKIEHEAIKANKEYTIFVNGILLTPTNGDVVVKDGVITINNSEDAKFDNLDYVVFEIDDADEERIALVFDNTVSYFSIRIDDNGAPTSYNDCDTALLYTEGGILLDKAAVNKPVNPAEGYYKNGQIIREVDHYGNYEYYIYDYEKPIRLTDEEMEELNDLIGYYATSGSIHLTGNENIYDSYVYYAYNYANTIDEPLIIGHRNDLEIPVMKYNPSLTNPDLEYETYKSGAGREEGWEMNRNSLSTYINGLIMENKEINGVQNVTRHFSITYPKLIMKCCEYYDNKDLLKALNTIYNKKEEGYFKDEMIDDKYTVKDYFYSESLYRDALALAKYMNEDMKKEVITYIVEKIEREESIATYRDFINLETKRQDINHIQIYKPIQDTIEVDYSLAPGTTHVYLNGVLLSYDEYCKFNNNKILFNIDVCGLQQLPSAEKMAESLPDHLSRLEKIDYELELKNKQVLRIIEDKPYYIPTSSRDTILVEKRQDMSIRSITYELLDSSFRATDNVIEITQDLYDIPESMIYSADELKIYINGVLYDEGYETIKEGPSKGIRLFNSSSLVKDPLDDYFKEFPEKLEIYEQLNGKKYTKRKVQITIEWR